MPPSKTRDRYALLARLGTDPPPDDDQEEYDDNKYKGGDEYAAFLRDLKRGKIDDPVMSSSRAQRSTRAVGHESVQSVPELTKRMSKEQEMYRKRLGKIEDLMWQHKQTERELKRSEGDIIKDQRQVRESLRQYEQAIARKKTADERKLDSTLKTYSEMEKSHVRNTNKMSKERTDQQRSSETVNKTKGRKFDVDISRMQRTYQMKRDALDLKKVEADRIAREYEAKLRTKEEEQLSLKAELAELAIAMNASAHKSKEFQSEAEKGKQTETHRQIEMDLSNEENLRQQLARSNVDVKLSDTTRRKTNAELTLTRAHLAMKQREGGRHLQDVRTNLQDSRTTQKKLNDAAFDAEQDLRAREIQGRVELVTAKRQALMESQSRARQERDDNMDGLMRDKHGKRDNDTNQSLVRDQLKHFQKSVRKNEETEIQLFNRVRDSEYQRQKQDQSVRDLQRKLEKVRRDNAARLKRDMVDCERMERDLLVDIMKEQSQLTKVHNQREYSFYKLQNHRFQQTEDKHLYDKHDKQYQRLVRIGQKIE